MNYRIDSSTLKPLTFNELEKLLNKQQSERMKMQQYIRIGVRNATTQMLSDIEKNIHDIKLRMRQVKAGKRVLVADRALVSYLVKKHSLDVAQMSEEIANEEVRKAISESNGNEPVAVNGLTFYLKDHRIVGID